MAEEMKPLSLRDRLMIEIAFCRHADLPVSEEATRILSICSTRTPPTPTEGAEIECLRGKMRMIVAHASGGRLSESSDIDRSINDICVEISRHRNDVWNQAKESSEAELTRLRQRVAELEEWHRQACCQLAICARIDHKEIKKQTREWLEDTLIARADHARYSLTHQPNGGARHEQG